MPRHLPLVIAALLAACSDGAETVGPERGDTGTAPAFAAQHLDRYNAREPWTLNLWYDCSPPAETVRLDGTMHTVSMMIVDGNGVNRWSFHSHPIRFRGVGLTSGREFKVVGAENTTRQIYPDNHRHFHQTAILRLMTDGDPDWTLRVLVDRERTPPADWVYRINQFEVTCQ
jgi:hypothetical protein